MKSPFAIEFRELVRLAIPIAAAQAGNQLMGVVDTAVVGRLGAGPLGAVGLGNSIYFAFAIFGMGLVMGVDPLASQAFGAMDHARARRLLWQGMWLAIGVGALLSIVMFATPLLINRLHIEPPIAAMANTYLVWRTPSIIPMLIFIVIRAYLQAEGTTRPMVTAMVVGNFFNLGADILLVFGGRVLPEWAGPLRAIPAMGVAGAAFASVLGTILQLWIVARAVRRIAVPFGARPLHEPIASEIAHAAKIGAPVALQWGAEIGVFSLAGILAAKFGEAQLAAHQVVLTIASFTFTVAAGIGSAGSVRVGRAVGAIDREAARRAGLVAFVAGTAFMVCSALMFVLLPARLAALLTDQQSVILASIPILGVAAFFQVSDGVQAVGSGVLRGAGDTRFPFLANLAGHWLVGLPIAIYLGFYLEQGVVGIWWGLAAGLTAVAIFLFIRFERRSMRPIRPLHS